MERTDVLQQWRDKKVPTHRTLLPLYAAVPLHAMASSVGRDRRDDPGYDWHGLQRGTTPFVVVQHTFAGHGLLDWQGTTRRIEADQTLVITVPHDHRYRVEPGHAWDFGYFVLHGVEVVRLATAYIDARGPVARLDAATLATLADVAVTMLGTPTPMAGAISSLAYRAAAALIDDLPVRRDRDVRPDWLRRVVERVRLADHGNDHATLTVEALAAEAGMSRWHFSRRFQELMGVPPSEYVVQHRLRLAAHRLQAGHDPIARIAADIGFADAGYFARAFRKRFGITPGGFRRSGMYHQ